MASGKTIIVHNFTYLDTDTVELRRGPSKRTAEAIIRNKHNIVPNTAEVVDAALVDNEGRYRPEWASDRTD